MNPFRRYGDDPAQANAAASEAHQKRLIESGQMGGVTVANCALRPATDAIAVRRSGPKACEATLVAVQVVEGQMSTSLVLSPADARRVAMAMLDAADEADGVAHLSFVIEGEDPRP